MVDADASLNTYFRKHIENMGVSFFQKPYQIIKDMEIKELLAKMNEQSKGITTPDFPSIMPIIHPEERVTIPSAISQQEKIAAYVAVAANDIIYKAMI
jgi:hypothetical protein